MMTEKIVVSDTNIFIDLIKLDLLGDFFSLPWNINIKHDELLMFREKEECVMG